MRTHKSLPRRKVGTFVVCNGFVLKMTRRGWKKYSGCTFDPSLMDLSITGETAIRVTAKK